MVRRFEEISNNAWPALQTFQYDGWVLRFANGVTKRANSVGMLYPSTLDPDKKITFCEHLYKDQGITPCFKITAAGDPEDIDQRLENRGYLVHSHISFQTLPLSTSGNSLLVAKNGQDTDAAGLRKTMVDTILNSWWIDEFIRMNGFDPQRRSTYINIMERTLTPKCLISVLQEERTIGVGLGVAEGKYIGLFDIVVDPECRNQGIGKRIVETILRWGRDMGAEIAYLQVLTDNIPAINLYRNLGFSGIYQYHYRMKFS